MSPNRPANALIDKRPSAELPRIGDVCPQSHWFTDGEFLMKTIAMLALVAGGFALTAPASAASLGSGLAPVVTKSHQTTKICDCDSRADGSAGFYSGFVDTPAYAPYTDGYTSGFIGDTAGDEDSAAPPYASFPDRSRTYRMWGWQRTYADRS